MQKERGKQSKQTNLRSGIKKNRFKGARLVAPALLPELFQHEIDKRSLCGKSNNKIYLLRSLSSDLMLQILRIRP